MGRFPIPDHGIDRTRMKRDRHFAVNPDRRRHLPGIEVGGSLIE
jgi:hypothetical protein